ncbi:hypothetical protein Q7P37_005384 [Cladosporium fusiforme]
MAAAAALRTAVRDLRVAVLYQALPPPVIKGVSKPLKPGGYRDSGADIAFTLRQCNAKSVSVVTPQHHPDPAGDTGWCFPDTEEGILAAIEKGANCLWANTILFKEHPLQNSEKILLSNVRVVGQPPCLVEAYDDKDFVNSWLRRTGTFSMPKSCTAEAGEDLEHLLVKHSLLLPVVAKPIRGRGSQGVRVCRSMEELEAHLRALETKSLLEEFLPGDEGTVTVMPPSDARPQYWALPLVERFGHAAGIAPYSGRVAVSVNSRVLDLGEARREDAVAVREVAGQCERVAELLGVTAPIRIDVRKGSGIGAGYRIFDVNMKPNMTMPGRPGRENQASLTMLAAEGLGWSTRELVECILATARPLGELRDWVKKGIMTKADKSRAGRLGQQEMQGQGKAKRAGPTVRASGRRGRVGAWRKRFDDSFTVKMFTNDKLPCSPRQMATLGRVCSYSQWPRRRDRDSETRDTHQEGEIPGGNAREVSEVGGQRYLVAMLQPPCEDPAASLMRPRHSICPLTKVIPLPHHYQHHHKAKLMRPASPPHVHNSYISTQTASPPDGAHLRVFWNIARADMLVSPSTLSCHPTEHPSGVTNHVSTTLCHRLVGLNAFLRWAWTCRRIASPAALHLRARHAVLSWHPGRLWVIDTILAAFPRHPSIISISSTRHSSSSSTRPLSHAAPLHRDIRPPLHLPPPLSPPSPTPDRPPTMTDRVVQAPGPLTEEKIYDHDIESAPSSSKTQSKEGRKVGDGVENYGDLERSTTVHEGEQKYNRLGWMKLTTLLIVEAIALGSLSVPSAFASVGMVAGVILCVGIGLIAIYTSYVVGQVKMKHPHVEHYADAVRLIWGRFGYELTGAMFALFLILLVGSHTLTGTIAFIRIVDEPAMCALIWGVISAIILFLLAVPPSFSEFAILGYIDFASIVIAIGITIIATGIQSNSAEAAAATWSAWPPADMTLKSAFLSTTNIVFAYSFAVCQFSFMSEMHTPSDYVKSIWALGLIEIFIYTITGALIYAFVGTDVASPALLSAGGKVSRIAFGIALPVIFISGSINTVVVGRYIINRALPNSPIKYINTKAGWAVWLTLIAVITVISWIIAEAIPFFNALLGLISSLFISGFTFYFPALFWFQLIKEGKWNASRKNIALSILNGCIFCIGLAILGLGTYASVADIADSYATGEGVRSPFTCDASSYE